MKVSAEFARSHFSVVENVLDYGEKVELTLQDGRVFEFKEKTAGPTTSTIESRSAMFDSWQGKVRLIEGWDSPEVNAEIWEEFWAKCEEEASTQSTQQQAQ